MNAQRLTALWERWNERPSDRTRANHLEDEVQRVAGLLGCTGTQLRQAVVDRVMAGEQLHEAIEVVVG